MFRCDFCENYKDKSECCENPLDDCSMICRECQDEKFSCSICGEIEKSVLHDENHICDDCNQDEINKTALMNEFYQEWLGLDGNLPIHI